MTLLFDGAGQRKYLTPAQREDFLSAAKVAPEKVFTFCFTLGLTGCRLSEALALTGNRVDISAGLVLLESLKKRRRGVFRAVPLPPDFLDRLASIHDLSTLGDRRLWSWSRTTAWRRVKEIMQATISTVPAQSKRPPPRFWNKGRDLRCAPQHDPEVAGSFANGNHSHLHRRDRQRGTADR